jgi:hypothetical protein
MFGVAIDWSDFFIANADVWSHASYMAVVSDFGYFHKISCSTGNRYVGGIDNADNDGKTGYCLTC